MIDDLVSIITPCYNAEKYIAETIESVISQTYPRWEMLIVDDGSRDHSVGIVESYASTDNRIQLIRQPNAGTACARNTGLKRAEGRYIALLDADDVWESSFLDKQLAFLKCSGAVCVCSGYRHIDQNSREIQHPTVPLPVITLNDMRVMNRIGCLTGLYDSKEHGKVYLHEEFRSIRDDYAYWYDIISLAGKAYGNQEILARYRVLQESTTGNKLKLISKQFRFYRDYLQESAVTSLINTLRWGVSGLRKFS
ncbi:MAG: glycosyltransferase family 2 protein [Clostridia bacterium]|nr:glycosyltransferase family 2 protein [Clostridia bacterium]